MPKVRSDKIDFMQQFWYWISERQAIYERRQKGKQPPWTEDPVLRDYFFTNPYRENDAGTRYYLDNIATLSNPRDLIFDTLGYRYFNWEPTWEFLCKHFGRDYVRWGKWDHKEIAYVLTQWEEGGNKVFTPAFTVTGVRFGGYPDKISNVCWLVEYFQSQVRAILPAIVNADNLRDIFVVVQGLKGMGDFLAYEVACDLAYTWLTKDSVSENDFVNPGPGCRLGLNYIYPDRKDYKTLINELRLDQDKVFKRYGLPWRRGNKELTLRSIEHSLCEFSKYARTKFHVMPDGRTTTWQTRRYRPSLQAALL